MIRFGKVHLLKKKGAIGLSILALAISLGYSDIVVASEENTYASGGFVISTFESDNSLDAVLNELGSETKLQYRAYIPDENGVNTNNEEWQTVNQGTNLSDGEYEFRVISSSDLKDEDIAAVISLIINSTAADVNSDITNETPNVVKKVIIAQPQPEPKSLSELIKDSKLFLLAFIGTIAGLFLHLFIVDKSYSSFHIEGRLSARFSIKIDTPLKPKQLQFDSKKGEFKVTKLCREEPYNLTIIDLKTKSQVAVVKIWLEKKDSDAEIIFNNGVDIDSVPVRKGMRITVKEKYSPPKNVAVQC